MVSGIMQSRGICLHLWGFCLRNRDDYFSGFAPLANGKMALLGGCENKKAGIVYEFTHISARGPGATSGYADYRLFPLPT